MQIEKAFVVSAVILVLLSACADSKNEDAKKSLKKISVAITKPSSITKAKPKMPVVLKKPNERERFDQHVLVQKRKKVLSSIDEGIQMIDNELN